MVFIIIVTNGNFGGGTCSRSTFRELLGIQIDTRDFRVVGTEDILDNFDSTMRRSRNRNGTLFLTPRSRTCNPGRTACAIALGIVTTGLSSSTSMVEYTIFEAVVQISKGDFMLETLDKASSYVEQRRASNTQSEFYREINRLELHVLFHNDLPQPRWLPYLY